MTEPLEPGYAYFANFAAEHRLRGPYLTFDEAEADARARVQSLLAQQAPESDLRFVIVVQPLDDAAREALDNRYDFYVNFAYETGMRGPFDTMRQAALHAQEHVQELLAKGWTAEQCKYVRVPIPQLQAPTA